MFRRRLAIALITATAVPAALTASADAARLNIRWEKLTVPVTSPAPEATTAQNSSAVVSLGKLGRVE